MKGIKEIKVMHTLLSKAIGLRFHKRIEDKAYLFPFDEPLKVSLDMFFVHFPIDVLFLDEKRKIIEMKENFRPYSFYMTKKKVSYVLELPKGYIGKNKNKIGQKIDF